MLEQIGLGVAMFSGIVLALTGIFLVKGRRGLAGRGGVLMVIGWVREPLLKRSRKLAEF